MHGSREPVTRKQLVWMKQHWDLFNAEFGHLGLKKREWKAMTVDGLRQWLLGKGVVMAPPRDGNPGIFVRLPDQLHAWVTEQGGAGFIRNLVAEKAQGHLSAAAIAGWADTGESNGVCLWRRRNRWLCLPPGQEPEADSEDYCSQRAALIVARRPGVRERLSFEERMWGRAALARRKGQCPVSTNRSEAAARHPQGG